MSHVPTKKPNSLQRLSELKVLIEEFGLKAKLRSHAGLALVVAAALDRMLEHALRTKMGTLNNKLEEKLFGDYGSLRDFSTKIDLSFALRLIDSGTYQRLTTVRKIRNDMAHADGFVDFKTIAIRKLLANLTDESSTVNPDDPEDVFISSAAAIESAIATTSRLPNQGIIDKFKADW